LGQGWETGHEYACSILDSKFRYLTLDPMTILSGVRMRGKDRLSLVGNEARIVWRLSVKFL